MTSRKIFTISLSILMGMAMVTKLNAHETELGHEGNVVGAPLLPAHQNRPPNKVDNSLEVQIFLNIPTQKGYDKEIFKKKVKVGFYVSPQDYENNVPPLYQAETDSGTLTIDSSVLKPGDYSVRILDVPKNFVRNTENYGVSIGGNQKRAPLKLDLYQHQSEMTLVHEVDGLQKPVEAKLVRGTLKHIQTNRSTQFEKLTNYDGKIAFTTDLESGDTEVTLTEVEGFTLPTPKKVTLNKPFEAFGSMKPVNITVPVDFAVARIVTTNNVQEILAGAEYEVYKDGVKLDVKQKQENNQTLFYFPVFGNYQIKQIKAPVGYELRQNLLPLEINGSQTFEFVNQKIAVSPEPINRSVAVFTTTNNDIILEGAEYEVLKGGMKVDVAQDKSLKQTTIHFSEDGVYHLKQIKAPKGYDLLAKPVAITVPFKGPFVIVNRKSDVTYDGEVETKPGVEKTMKAGISPHENNEKLHEVVDAVTTVVKNPNTQAVKDTDANQTLPQTGVDNRLLVMGGMLTCLGLISIIVKKKLETRIKA